MTDDLNVPLTPEETARLTDFARACKAAARAVVLYPGGHPAIGATLARITDLTSSANLRAPLTLMVIPDALMLGGRVAARPDGSIAELAALLHSHLIGQITVHPGGDAEAWRQFLLLIGRAPDSIRGEGGIARVWTTMAGRHIELREIDYGEVLKERAAGESAAWHRVVTDCLQGGVVEFDQEALRELLGLSSGDTGLGAIIAQLEERADAEGVTAGAKTSALMRMLRAVVEAVSKNQPDRLEPVLRSMGSAVGQLSPDTIMGLLSNRSEEGQQVMTAVVSHMSDGTIASFVARNVIRESATERLAQAFHTLVRSEEERQRLLSLARDDVAASPLGSTEGFETVWNHVAQKLLTSYSDEPYISDDYARDLSASRLQAIEVEQVSDDPPERLTAWLGTVATSVLRGLDLTLLDDLLRIEPDDGKWGELMLPVVALLEDLFLVGDFDAAEGLLAVVVGATAPTASKERRQHAMIAIDALVAGSMLRHVITHLATIDDKQFEGVKAMCVSLGEVLVRPLAEALSAEGRGRTRERLTAILIAFGNVARRTVENLKHSPNAAVRRTAIYLLREFGGSGALPDLTELADDNEPQVQREAVHAILNIGTDEAYRVLQQALSRGTTRSREGIMKSLSGTHDERAAPLFIYILRHVDHRGKLALVFLRAIESLGALRDPAGILPLTEALYKGEWWSPGRTRSLRSAAAAALAHIGTPEAYAALEEAATGGSRGVRAAARAQLKSARRQPAQRTGAA